MTCSHYHQNNSKDNNTDNYSVGQTTISLAVTLISWCRYKSPCLALGSETESRWMDKACLEHQGSSDPPASPPRAPETTATTPISKPSVLHPKYVIFPKHRSKVAVPCRLPTGKTQLLPPCCLQTAFLTPSCLYSPARACLPDPRPQCQIREFVSEPRNLGPVSSRVNVLLE